MIDAQTSPDEKVHRIPLSELHPFPGHPFSVREDEAMRETVESVKAYGILVPAVARPREEGGYELVSGHRRIGKAPGRGKGPSIHLKVF